MSAPRIERHPGRPPAGALFSIVIPSWNNLPYLKLCVESIRRHSAFPHQIIVHVNDGSDGTLEWVKQEGLDHTHSAVNAGICWPVNMVRTLVQTEYILFMNDDMFVCPGWDLALREEIQIAGDRPFYLSATMLEPYPTHSKPVIAPVNYGTTVETFDEARLLRDFATHAKPDWCGATRPPSLVPLNLWDLVGGYSVELSPGFYSDPDFSMKLWQAGVRYFKGAGASRVYHFVSKSVGRTAMNNGRIQFLKKWGMSASTFQKRFLRLGEPWPENGMPPPPPSATETSGAFRLARWQQRFAAPTLPTTGGDSAEKETR